MPTTLTIATQLGFYYPQNMPVESLTTEVNGDLEPSAYCAGEEACWQSTDDIEEWMKKILVLSAWSFEHMDLDAQDGLIDFFHQLIAEGFTAYLENERRDVSTVIGVTASSVEDDGLEAALCCASS